MRWLLLGVLLFACDGEAAVDSGVGGRDAGATDGAAPDSGRTGGTDAGGTDAGGSDAATPPDGGGDDAGPPAPAVSDDFDGASLDPRWTVRRPETIELAVTGGALRIRPTRRVLWFNASSGPMLHQVVTGDFRVTARVRTTTLDGSGPPTGFVHLAGLIARDPASDEGADEEYVFIVVGQDEDDLSVEHKTTTGSRSTYDGPSWPSGDAELRICRRGGTFELYQRPIDGGAWTLAMSYDRPDLPAALQVGPVLYANTDPPDLEARWDEVRFASVSSPTDCTAE